MPLSPIGNTPRHPSSSGKGWDVPTLLHEAATPLQAALGLLETQAGGLDAGRCRQVRDLLGQIKDLFHAAGNHPLTEGPTAPWDALGRALEGARLRHPGRRLILTGDDACRAPHRHDRLALERTASNWVLNALRHAPGSEVRVRLGMNAAGTELRLEVEDDGEGLGRRALAKAFLRGWRGAEAGARDPDGKGLGLSIVRRLAAAAGGRVTGGRSPSGGCRFTLRLPASPSAVVPEPVPERATGAKVAVIDDDATSSAVAVLGLRAEGIGAETLRPGRDMAREILGGPWEAILLDRNLGRIDGARLARRLRAAGWAGGIVLWTGDGRPPPPEVDRCLRKPASRREIADAVEEAVAESRDRRAARKVLEGELAEGARQIEAAAGEPGRLGPLAHRLAGALGLAGYPAAARRAQAVERACARGRGAGPWRKLIGDLRALAKRAG